MRDNPFPDLDHQRLTFLGQTRDVWVTGEGPAVLVMHEVPGLYPEVVEFGRWVAEAGFTVWMPSVIGTPGKPFSAVYDLSSLARACVSKEFTVWGTGRTSPIVDWLRALGAHAHEVCGGPGIGAVGMCLTGGFALAMASDERMLAPVLSQPSLPFALIPGRGKDLGVPADELVRIQRRTREDGLCVMGLRFTEDPLVPAKRFKALREALGDAFIAIELDSSKGNGAGFPLHAHSVLVREHVPEPGHPSERARQRVRDFFVKRLKPGR
ncbi:MAG: dienelactone hydrolase family protein [Myxococcales bacterium]|nr:dienelactone hydrolase family protein [Myxococcales bacterium]